MATLQLEDQLAEALKAQTQAKGLSVEAYLRAVAQPTEPSMPTPVSEHDVAEFDAALDELFAGDRGPLTSLPPKPMSGGANSSSHTL